MSQQKHLAEVKKQLENLRTKTIMASNGLMVGDKKTVARISEINKVDTAKK
jgi:site-specific DNA-adenine methylase